MKCKDCPELIERYGYCPVAEDWVTEKINKFSFGTPKIINSDGLIINIYN